MKQADLIRLYKWANHSAILPYAEKFTRAQWITINESGFPNLIGKMDPLYINSFLQACEMMAGMGNLQSSTAKAMLDSLKAQLKTAPISLQSVLTWLGTDLANRVQTDTSSYAMMDDLVQLLSDKAVRDRLERPLVSQDRRLHGKDIRELYRSRAITLKHFIDIIRASSDLKQRQLPDWVGNDVEMTTLAEEFSDEQLALLPSLLTNSIRRDRALTSGFLRSILAKTTINEDQTIKNCPIDSFQAIVLSLQPLFLQAATQGVARFSDTFISNTAMLHSSLYDGGTSSFAHDLIKRHVAKYKSVPIVPTEENEAIQCALRNAAYAGNYWDLLPLTILTTAINSKGGESGKTALHRAVESLNRTGDRLCFDLLANHPDIDFSVRDAAGKTALDYWDFKKFPDRALLSTRNAFIAPLVGASLSPLRSSSVFPPPQVPTAASVASASVGAEINLDEILDSLNI